MANPPTRRGSRPPPQNRHFCITFATPCLHVALYRLCLVITSPLLRFCLTFGTSNRLNIATFASLLPCLAVTLPLHYLRLACTSFCFSTPRFRNTFATVFAICQFHDSSSSLGKTYDRDIYESKALIATQRDTTHHMTPKNHPTYLPNRSNMAPRWPKNGILLAYLHLVFLAFARRTT